MDWSNEAVLEFIELIQDEPCIWDPKSKDRRSRVIVQDAWERIKDNFSLDCSIEEMKRKRNTLLTQYREYVKKIKDSAKSDSGEIYRPSWFAFDAIHSYMGPIYELSGTFEENSDVKPSLRESFVEVHMSPESDTERPLTPESNCPNGNNSILNAKRHRLVKKQRDEPHSVIRSNLRNKEHERETNECELYGQLIAQKLKSLDEDDRLVLMNEMDNLVFKFIMNARKRSRLVGFSNDISGCPKEETNVSD